MLLEEKMIKMMDRSKQNFAHEEHRGHHRPSVSLINV